MIQKQSLKVGAQPLVSVIVPVYKVEKYIHRCIDCLPITSSFVKILANCIAIYMLNITTNRSVRISKCERSVTLAEY